MKKKKLNIGEQIAYLDKKGIKFNAESKDAAIEYLTKNNNYFKLTAYRKNFQKHPDGENKDAYIDLDFAYLKDLAIIDMRLRYLLLHMCLDIEHFAKVRLLQALEDCEDDGYDIVEAFIESLDEYQKPAIMSELNRNKKNSYCGPLMEKYQNNFPAWAFIEVIPFGRFISFYRFFGKKFDNKKMINEFYLLTGVRELRNASAHNNCILNDLSPNTAKNRTNLFVSEALGKTGITRHIHRTSMTNTRIQQIITLLYTHKELVTSEGVHQHQAEMLQDFTKRIFRNKSYYEKQPMIFSTFDFLKKVIDEWYGV